MLKSYVHKSLVSHAFNYVPGITVLGAFVYVLVKHPYLMGFKSQYDISGSASDALLFLAFFLILLLIVFQFHKSYLLYVPSTYLSFDSTGISFKRFKKEYRFIKWEEVEVVDLKIESEWLLNMYVKTKSEGSVRIELSELPILSIIKKPGVRYNFLKLAAVANENPMLKEKLNLEQMEDLYIYSNVRLKSLT